jgi:3-phenylpropionate/trans-cinnamate dioxygenase ferredoxin reductase component
VQGTQSGEQWREARPARASLLSSVLCKGVALAGMVCCMAAREVEYLLIGGGLASANCARWLRESGADGDVLLVGREPDPPYNRPNCSKGYLRGEEQREEAYFRPDDFWGEQRIELLTRTSATALDLDARTVKLSNKEDVQFSKLLLATGANVRRLNVDGCELEDIYYLRTLGNALSIREGLADAEHVVMIGGSYIACEVAASLTKVGKRCTIVMQEGVTLERSFGPDAGRFFNELLAEHGVTIHPHDELERFEGSDGRVTRVITRGGLQLDAEGVVVGAGVTPDVALAQSAGLPLGDRGGVRCSSRLETSTPGVFAAGDICEYDSPVHGGGPMRIEHWDVAFNHGKAAALNMLGEDLPYEEVPYFFSVLADWGELEYVGPAFDWDQEVVRGSLSDGNFTNWYLEDGVVKAALTFGRSDDLDHARRLLADGTPLADHEQAALADLDADLAAVRA